jgi:spore germination cell wall hydrolase CwlJ-like protein
MESLVTTITQPVVNLKELQCLARNIFFEAASEPEEGKVAVGLVTLNRVQDGRFAQSVCGVVDQKLVKDVPKDIVVEKRSLFRTERETQTVWSKLTICQFSWRCVSVKDPKGTDERWEESQRIARDLLAMSDSYPDLRNKYGEALYFHNVSVRPVWAKQKESVGRVGGHWFYRDR